MPNSIDSVSPQTAYQHLQELESADTATCAEYRQDALEVLADPDVALKERQAIADRLNQANHRLELRTVVTDESY